MGMIVRSAVVGLVAVVGLGGCTSTMIEEGGKLINRFFPPTPQSQGVNQQQTTLSGTLSSNGATRDHEVRLTAGRQVLIDVESTSFDTILRVFDPSGNEVASDDDSGGGPDGTNSRVTFSPSVTGSYRVRVEAYEGEGTGAYSGRVWIS